MFKRSREKCHVCGSRRLYKFKADASDAKNSTKVNIVECLNCHFAWQHPLGRTEGQSAQFFEDSYADAGKTTSDYFSASRKTQIAKLEFDFISTLPVKNKTLLDVGAGSGVFAEIATLSNWQVTAVDPALYLDEKTVYGFRAIKGTLEQIPKGELFDVVTLWDVIEHVPDPLSFINTVSKYLKSGGFLVIETGNYKSAERVYGEKSHWMYQLDHRWYFSPRSIEYLLKKVGFSEFIYCKKCLRPDWNGTVEYAGPSRAHLLKSIAKNPLRIFIYLKIHFNLCKAKHWEMPGIGIFSLAATKPKT